jgi:hypothetical protein
MPPLFHAYPVSAHRGELLCHAQYGASSKYPRLIGYRTSYIIVADCGPEVVLAAVEADRLDSDTLTV